MEWRTRALAAPLVTVLSASLAAGGLGACAHGTPIKEAQPSLLEPVELPEAPPVAPSAPAPGPVVEYRIGVPDELDITVYGEPDLAVKQAVRPDGRIAFPMAGEIVAAGLTPAELQRELTRAVGRYVRNPLVNVVITSYASQRIRVLGQVEKPGAIVLRADVDLIDAIAEAGGMKDDADLPRALLLREGAVVPVDFERLIRFGDVTQNVQLQPRDVVLIPSAADRKAFVLGHVNSPSTIRLRGEVTLIEAIALAGGVAKDAYERGTLLVRGSLSNPSLYRVDLAAIVKDGDLAQNVALEPGDIVYVPQETIYQLADYAEALRRILDLVVVSMSAIALWPAVENAVQGGGAASTPPVVVSP